MSGMFLFREFDALDPDDDKKYGFGNESDSDEEHGPVINTTTISSPQLGRKKKASMSMSPKMVAVSSPALRAPSSLRQSSSHGNIESPKSVLSKSSALPRSTASLIPEPSPREVKFSAPTPTAAASTPDLSLLRPKNAPSLVPVMLPSRSRSLAPGDEGSNAALKIRLLSESKDSLVSRRRGSSISELHKTKEMLPPTVAPGSPSLQPKSILKKSSKSMDILSPVAVERASSSTQPSPSLHHSTASLLIPTKSAADRRISKSDPKTKKISELNVSTNSLLSMMDLGEKKNDQRAEERRKLQATQEAFKARYEQTFGREKSVKLFGE